MQAQPINFPLLLQQIENKMYLKEHLVEFIQKAGIKLILTKYNSGFRGTKRLVDKIMQEPDLFQLILFPQEKEEQALLVLSFQKEEFRIIVAQTINNHYKIVSEQLNNLYATNKEVFQRQFQILIDLASESDGEIGLKAVKGITKMLKLQEQQFLEDEMFYQLLLTGVKHEDDQVRVRFMEICMEVSNNNEQSHNKLVEMGILDVCIQQTTSSDILLRLASVETISKLGNRLYNSKYLSEHKIMNKIILDAFSQKEELYVRKYLALLISKLLAKKTMEFTVSLMQNFLDLLLYLFSQPGEEEAIAAVDIIANLSRTQAGIDVILRKIELVAVYLSMSNNSKDFIKQRFYSSFSSFFAISPTEKKNQHTLSNIMICFGNEQQLNFVQWKSMPVNYGFLQDSMEKIFNNLFLPFPELELECLYLVENIIQWEVLCKWFIGHSKCIEYFTLYEAKNGEIFQKKNDIYDNILILCTQKYKNDQDTFAQFALQLKTARQQVTKQKLTQAKQGREEMQYDMEAN